MENKQDKGFTLVELLIVIVILGILATVTVFAVRGITDQGKNSACATEEATILTATEAFYAQEGSLPAADFSDLTPLYLTEDPLVLAATWTLDPGTTGTAATSSTPAVAPVAASVTPVVGGKCEDFAG